MLEKALKLLVRVLRARVPRMTLLSNTSCTPQEKSLLAPHYRALVVESFGVGGLPGGEHGEMYARLQDWCTSGRLAVFTTQVPHEGCDLAVYEVGRSVKELPGVLEAKDMTPEAVAVKLMWALGQTTDRAEAMRLFTTPVEWDIV